MSQHVWCLLAGLVVLADLSSATADPVIYSHYEQGQRVENFRQAVHSAVLISPRVRADWFSFEASREAERGARGGYYPSVDVYSEWGEEERKTPLADFSGDAYSRDASRLSVTQMLFDGFATRDEVRRLGFTKLSDYYELQRASEEVALEAAEAYLETLKFQKLVRLAEDNLAVHRDVLDRIAERTRGGVSQGVDLDQAEARVALAESNLLTEKTNLHDLNAQFLRVVGAEPAAQLKVPEIPTGIVPARAREALEIAYTSSPVVNASIENLRAQQEALNATSAPMMPRVDLRYRNELEHDTDGFEGRYEEEAIELVFSYNLYRGGRDSARKREFSNRYYAAVEERRQACLNVRQEVSIAYNDLAALQRQVELRKRNLEAQDKTRRAYRDQFDLGQRTLLDLLDSQNEYFDTQRAFVSATADLASARARILATMGLLMSTMELEGLNADKIAALELELTRNPEDENGFHTCPSLPLTAQIP